MFKSSFDFGGSFMDEVLKALSEKESQLESTNEKTSTGSPENLATPTGYRPQSPPGFTSMGGDSRAQPPPLPAQPPRAVSTIWALVS